MKTWIVTLLIAALPAMGSNVLIYDPPTGVIIAYIISANTPSYAGMTNVLIDPVLPATPLEFSLATNGVVVAMTAAQSNAVLAARAAVADASLRMNARDPVTKLSAEGLVLRAFADTARDEINLLRLELSIAKTNMTLFQSRATMPPRTLAQLQTAITNKVTSGSVD
jgi:hypothetical protein